MTPAEGIAWLSSELKKAKNAARRGAQAVRADVPGETGPPQFAPPRPTRHTRPPSEFPRGSVHLDGTHRSRNQAK